MLFSWSQTASPCWSWSDWCAKASQDCPEPNREQRNYWLSLSLSLHTSCQFYFLLPPNLMLTRTPVASCAQNHSAEQLWEQHDLFLWAFTFLDYDLIQTSHLRLPGNKSWQVVIIIHFFWLLSQSQSSHESVQIYAQTTTVKNNMIVHITMLQVQ